MTRRKTKSAALPDAAESVRKDVTADNVERLAASGCTPSEAAAWFGLSPAAFRMRLAEPALRGVWLRGKRCGRARIRMAQLDHAEKNMTMALHLGRHLLGQADAEEAAGGRVTLIVDTGIRRGDPQD